MNIGKWSVQRRRSIVEISPHWTNIIFRNRCHTHVSSSFAGDWNLPIIVDMPLMPLMRRGMMMMIYLLLLATLRSAIFSRWRINEQFRFLLFLSLSLDNNLSSSVDLCVCVRQILSSFGCFLSFSSCCTFVFLSFIQMINVDWKRRKKRRKRTTVDFSLALKIEPLIVWQLSKAKAEEEKEKSFPFT